MRNAVLCTNFLPEEELRKFLAKRLQDLEKEFFEVEGLQLSLAKKIEGNEYVSCITGRFRSESLMCRWSSDSLSKSIHFVMLKFEKRVNLLRHSYSFSAPLTINKKFH